MSLIYNNSEIPLSGVITYNGTSLEKVIYNNTTVWEKVPPIWDLSFSISQSITCSSRGSASAGLRDPDDPYSGCHTRSYVYISGSCSSSLSVSFPNIGFPSGTYTGTSMGASASAPVKGNITITASGSSSGSGEGGYNYTGCPDSANCWMTGSLASSTVSIPSLPITLSVRVSGYGHMRSNQSNGNEIWGLESYVECTGTSNISFTLPNLGKWTKASFPNGISGGGSCSINSVSIATKSSVTSISGDTLAISYSLSNMVRSNSGGLRASGVLRLEV